MVSLKIARQDGWDAMRHFRKYQKGRLTSNEYLNMVIESFEDALMSTSYLDYKEAISLKEARQDGWNIMRHFRKHQKRGLTSNEYLNMVIESFEDSLISTSYLDKE